MRNLRVLGVALFALFAFGAIAATAAFAEDEWLVEGAAINAPTRSESEGSIVLRNFEKAGLTPVLTEILCTGIFVGTVGGAAPNKGADTVTEVQTAGSVKVGTDNATLTGTPLICNVITDGGSIIGCTAGEGLAELWPANLPWKSEIDLTVTGMPLDLFSSGGTGEPGYEVECLSLAGIKGANLCVSPTGTDSTTTLIENFAGGGGIPASVLGTFDPFGTTEDELLANCSLTGEHTAEVFSDEGKSSDTWVAASLATRLATSFN